MKTAQFSIKLRIPAGKASSLPPVGPTLGQYRINPAEFCKDFNVQTEMWEESMIIPVLLIGYKNGDYEYIIKKPNTCFVLQITSDQNSFSKSPKNYYVSTITLQQLYELSYMYVSNSTFPNNSYQFIRHLYTLCGTVFSIGLYIT